MTLKRTELLLLIALSGCSGDSPTTPTPFWEGVTLYEHPRFKGGFALIRADVRDLDDLLDGCPHGYSHPLNWDDCASSIRVTTGWTATIYEDPQYRGRSLTVTSDITDLDDVSGPSGGNWNDRISSVRVTQK